MHRAILILGLAVVCSGCAALSALPAGTSSLLPSSTLDVHTETAVKLESGNFAVVKTNVIGSCKGFALFGLITVVPARYTTALDRLYERAEMRAGRPQTLAHLAVERSSTFLFLFSIPRVEIRADLVEFTPEPAAGQHLRMPQSSEAGPGTIPASDR